MVPETPDFVYTLDNHLSDTRDILELTVEVRDELNKRLDELEYCRALSATSAGSCIIYT